MGANADDMKGRAKRAAGEVTGDEDLKREGNVDKATGKVKNAADKIAEKARNVVNRD
jgi:uncharacterized protein YjbJ (UPF0337 family)